ncbi:ROK family transcriptional regulator [Novosphingobium sp.]|jgi:predicted NBD/HSP70 family sugar kinase|uniref:ROK family transcriptional regulator n=1 Tax=Novosphingobium sp. TaxID=1874826 RepID=UPI002FE18F43
MLLPALEKDQRRIIQELRKSGALSRSALAARLEISPAALTKLSRALLSMGVVEELGDPAHQARGRPAVPLRLASSGGYAVGATAHKGMLDIALVDFAGAVVATHHETIPPIDPRQFARKVREITHELVSRHNLLGQRMLGMGVAVPGPALSNDGERWSVVDALPGWRGAPLHEILSGELGWPLWLENDANAAALAEFYLGGLLRDFSTVVVLLLGYGIGAGVIVDGRLMRGQYGVAGEVGCLFPMDQPRPSPLDLLACLRADGCAITSVAEIDPTAAEQRPTIEAWLDRAAEQLEVVCNTAFAWIDPGAIVLAGPLPGEVLCGLEARLSRAALVVTVGNRRPPVRVSGLEGSPITLGAALLPIHALAA